MPDIRPVSSLPQGIAVGRYVSALIRAKGDPFVAQELSIHDTEWRSTPHVREALAFSTKAAANAGTMTDAAFGAPLAGPGVAGEAWSLINAASVLGRLTGVRRIPFNVSVPMDTSPATIGNWILEGRPIAASALSFVSIAPLMPTKIGTIVGISDELGRFGGVLAETAIRDAVTQKLSAKIDMNFLSPSAAPSSAGPGSITNGATAITSSGSTAAQITADLAAMVAAITTSAGTKTWVLNDKTASTIAGALGEKASGLPTTLNALPAIVSANAPAHQVTLLDAGAIAVAADPAGFAISVSKNAAIQMNDAPDSPPTASTVVTSFYQMDTYGVRVLATINWVRATPTAVSYMLTGY